MRRWIFLVALFLPGWGLEVAQPSFELKDCTNGIATVVVHNPSSQSLTVTVPAHAVLTHPQLQDQLLLGKARTLKLAPQGTSQFRSPALCVGERKESAQGQGFVLSQQPHAGAEQAEKMIDTCRRLQKDGDLPPMPMLPGNQVNVVAQWAYWSERGQANKQDLSRLVHEQLKPEPKDEPEVEKGVDNVWEAVDLTRKQAHS